MDGLFCDKKQKVYYGEDLLRVLREVGANECETLFIHSDIMFGTPVKGFNKKQYLQIIDDILDDLGVQNLIFPTFTYSFCNNKNYDVNNSKSLMGTLSEHVRKKEARFRTYDPLLSLSVPINLSASFLELGNHSLGYKSGFDILHGMDDVKFLFLGTRLGNCFTYVHYVEKMLEVPYEWDMVTSGDIIYENGSSEQKEQIIRTACKGVKIAEYNYFEDYLYDSGYLKRKNIGDSCVSCLSEKDAYREIELKINSSRDYFLEHGYTDEDLIHEYTHNSEVGHITHC